MRGETYLKRFHNYLDCVSIRESRPCTSFSKKKKKEKKLRRAHTNKLVSEVCELCRESERESEHAPWQVVPRQGP